jgi:uncharacterized OB-fold protein
MANKIKLIIVKCLNCGNYIATTWEDLDSQVDCCECGYSNEFLDIRIKNWQVEIEDYEGAPEDLR